MPDLDPSDDDRMMKAKFLLSALISCLPLMAVGCSAGGDSGASDELLSDVGQTYASIVFASYEDSAAAAADLEQAVVDFLDEPTATTLSEARKAWLAAREPYLQTEVYRFYGGPIDDEDDGPEGMINAWPLDEAYIDYVEGDDSSGIINDEEQEITADGLMELNEQGGEANIATGYHAIEFLLWGQDQSEDGPGDRPVDDYIDAPHADRRAQYLSVVSGLLTEQLEGLAAAWAPDEENYRADFTALDGLDSFANILAGMIVLSGFETGGERIQTALQSGDQEDEHSCFSDNTHRDMIQDIRGVLNVYLGTYTRLDGSKVTGASVKDAVLALDPELASDLEQQIRESLELARAIEPPFDQEIAIGNESGRDRLEALVESLRAQEDLLEEVFRAFDLSIPEPE